MKRWMQMWLVVLVVFLVIALPVAAFAEEAAASFTSAPATIVVQEVAKPVPAWLETLVGIVTLALTGLMGFLAKFVNQKINESKTNKQAAWQSMAMTAAGIAVRFAETMYKPDAGKGTEKRQAAIDYLVKRVPGMDVAHATELIDAAYRAWQDGIVAPLGAAPASVSSGT